MAVESTKTKEKKFKEKVKKWNKMTKKVCGVTLVCERERERERDEKIEKETELECL